MKVEILKHPTEEDWALCKQFALNTMGKNMITLPTDEWKVKILEAEHSPIRVLNFVIKMEIPSWVSVHYVRHNIGVLHCVQSQRNDRQNNYDRNKAPQDSPVSHMMYINAQELIHMAHKRLCRQASDETRQVMEVIVAEILKTNPEFKSVLVPLCAYRNGKCTEFYPCNRKDNTNE